MDPNEMSVLPVQSISEMPEKYSLAHLHRLSRMSRLEHSSPDLDTLVEQLKYFLMSELSVPAGMIYLFQDLASYLQLKAYWGLPDLASVILQIPVDQFHCQEVIEEQTVQLIEGLPVARLLFELGIDLSQTGWSHTLYTPLLAQGKIQGVLKMFFRKDQAPPASALPFFQILGHLIGGSVLNALLSYEEKLARENAALLRQASLALTENLDLEAVLSTLREYLERLVGFDSAFVTLFDSDEQADNPSCISDSFSPGICPLNQSGDGPFLLKDLLKKRQSVRSCDTEHIYIGHEGQAGERRHCWIFLPFVVGERVIGYYLLGKDRAVCYTDEQLKLAEALVSQAVVAIHNAWLFQQVSDAHKRMQQLSHRLVEVQENEKAYIARELHDEAGQALASIMVQLNLLSETAPDPHELKRRLEELERAVSTIMENLHAMAISLRPASLDHLGLGPGLRQYVEEFGSRFNIQAKYEQIGGDKRFPHEVENALFRIAQEALTNVARHARASQVDVLLAEIGSKLSLVIEDNGRGFFPERMETSGHFGLIGIQERVDMLGGRLLIESKPNKGTSLRVEIPLLDKIFSA